MDERFLAHVETLRPKLTELLEMEPVTPSSLPSLMPRAGVYLFSEGDRALYVGRSNGIRGRIRRHCRPGATHRMAALAFRLARETTGILRPSYRNDGTSRSALMLNPAFARAFQEAKVRIAAMSVRYVEEANPICQALLEIYAAVVLATPYNDFDNH